MVTIYLHGRESECDESLGLPAKVLYHPGEGRLGQLPPVTPEPPRLMQGADILSVGVPRIKVDKDSLG